MKIVLPLPPSENERLIVAWRQRKMILSAKYRKYKNLARSWLLVAWKQPIITPTKENQLALLIDVFMPHWKRDGHNITKPLLDVFEGIVYDNDRYVLPRFNRFFVDAANPRVEVTLYDTSI